MYHYIMPEDKTLPYFKYLHIDDFIKQLDFFEQEYGFVRKEGFFEALSTGIPPKGIVLTFDDGLAGHYKYVLPELKRRNLWGLFFVCTGIYKTGTLLDVHRIHTLLGCFGGKKVYDALQEILTDEMLTDDGREQFAKETYLTQVNDDYSLQVKQILNYFIDYTYRDAILERLMKLFFGCEADIFAGFYLTVQQMAEMKRDGMIVGSHTETHPVLSKLSPAQQEMEIKNSFSWLEGALGSLGEKTFCYPYGGFYSFTGDTEQILNENNVSCAFNFEARDVDETDLKTRRTALPRYDCNQFPFGKVRDMVGN